MAVISILLAAPFSCAGGQKKPFTIEDSIETAQFIYPYGTNPVVISPDGQRYLAVLGKGDTKRNGYWVELLCGSTSSLRAARNLRVAARLFSKSTAPADELIKDVRWLEDNRHVTFLWDDGQRPRRILRVNAITGQTETLVGHMTPIVDYDVSGDERTLVFDAETRHERSDDLALEKRGFAITDQSIWSILDGDFDGWTPTEHFDTFVLSRINGLLSQVREPQVTWTTPPELLRLSPNGRYAITVRPVVSVPAEWDGYTDHIFKDDLLSAARRNPHRPNLIREYFLIDVKNHTARPLWNAPQNPPAKVVWSPDGKTIVIGPTFLPLPADDPLGISGHAVVEVDAATGRCVPIPLPDQSKTIEYAPVRWSKEGALYLSGTGTANDKRLRLQKEHGVWMPVEGASSKRARLRGVQIQVRQGLNTPPALYANAPAAHKEELIFDPNPQLKQLTLGHVELVHWKGTDGRPWTGTLYYPVHYQSGRKFPLVIQTHGYSANRFLLDGAFTTAFAAQALANHDIAVLQVGNPDGPDDDFIVSPREPKVQMAGYQGAIDHFVASGLADRARVGIIGFSRTGWYVEYTLTHSSYRFAAADVADNMDASYLQYVLSDAAARSEFEADNGALPIGHGVEIWVHSAPGFNTDKMETPLRLEIDSGPVDSVLRDWEIFSNLRYLHKPVELFVIPEIQRGAHILQNPSQRLASQGSTVDWFCFWLKNEEDRAPAKEGEYKRWQALKPLVKQSE